MLVDEEENTMKRVYWTRRKMFCYYCSSPVAVNECLKRRHLENSRQRDFILPASRGGGYVIIIVCRYE
jgi:hypothetical protein